MSQLKSNYWSLTRHFPWNWDFLFRCKKINPKPTIRLGLFYNTNANLINSPHYIFVSSKSKHNVECSVITNNTEFTRQERQSLNWFMKHLTRIWLNYSSKPKIVLQRLKRLKVSFSFLKSMTFQNTRLFSFPNITCRSTVDEFTQKKLLLYRRSR
jgi:hypothetical protein